MYKRSTLIIALAITTAASASIMMISVAWRAGYTVGHSSLETVPAEQPHTVEEGRTMIAKVTSITGTTLHVNSLSVGAPAQPTTLDILVLTNTATSFKRSIPKDEKLITSEMANFVAQMKHHAATSTSAQPPLPFTINTISLTDIHPGDIIFVTAASKILSRQSVTATEIFDYPPPPTTKK